MCSEYEFIAKISRYIKNRYPEIFLLAGGPHVSLNPEECMHDSFDALCIGEGEYPTLEVVQQLENKIFPSEIPNIWIKYGNHIEKNNTRPFLEDLDKLPFPDRDMWSGWIVKGKPRFSVLLGRGCPYSCPYCSNHALKNLASGSYVRLRSVGNIRKEIEEILYSHPDTQRIYLEVETIISNKNFVLDLCQELGILNKTLAQPISYGVNVRITSNYKSLEEIFSAMQKSNFKYINVGVESGSERVRRQILKRNYSNADIIRIVQLARRYCLKVAFYNMIGIPGETLDDIKETVAINRICLPDWQAVNIFFPYPGTELHALCKNAGYIKGSLKTDMERNNAVLDLPSLSKKTIQHWMVWFDYYAFKGLRPIHNLLARVLLGNIKSKYRLNYWYNILIYVNLVVKLRTFLGLLGHPEA